MVFFCRGFKVYWQYYFFLRRLLRGTCWLIPSQGTSFTLLETTRGNINVFFSFSRLGFSFIVLSISWSYNELLKLKDVFECLRFILLMLLNPHLFKWKCVNLGLIFKINYFFSLFDKLLSCIVFANFQLLNSCIC